MDVYLRMSAVEQKDPEKFKAELIKEFGWGKLDREDAIIELDLRKHCPITFADTYKAGNRDRPILAHLNTQRLIWRFMIMQPRIVLTK